MNTQDITTVLMNFKHIYYDRTYFIFILFIFVYFIFILGSLEIDATQKFLGDCKNVENFICLNIIDDRYPRSMISRNLK